MTSRFVRPVRSHMEFRAHVAQQNSHVETDDQLHPIRAVPRSAAAGRHRGVEPAPNQMAIKSRWLLRVDAGPGSLRRVLSARACVSRSSRSRRRRDRTGDR